MFIMVQREDCSEAVSAGKTEILEALQGGRCVRDLRKTVLHHNYSEKVAKSSLNDSTKRLRMQLELCL